MVVDWDPNLHREISVLTVDLVQVQAVVHALFDALCVVVVSFFDPVVHHSLNPSVFVKQVEPHFTAKELGHE